MFNVVVNWILFFNLYVSTKTHLFYSIFPFFIFNFNCLWVFFVCGIVAFLRFLFYLFYIIGVRSCHQCFLLILYVCATNSLCGLSILFLGFMPFLQKFFFLFFAIFMLHCISHDYLNVTRHFKRMALKVKKQSNCFEPKKYIENKFQQNYLPKH